MPIVRVNLKFMAAQSNRNLNGVLFGLLCDRLFAAIGLGMESPGDFVETSTPTSMTGIVEVFEKRAIRAFRPWLQGLDRVEIFSLYHNGKIRKLQLRAEK